ncbi:MAG: Crp/Fnr family transcriptional regulator [Vibrio gallaecicus]|uniref:Crp/Fnr family transcriptional regulator n=1 Tax=Vibrio gallaecicus TaxID=552386 RepID=UPI0010C9928D|nr:Crp/Fnr family transcriptional regulator [Vibrio gallaecicus]MDN3616972.1 Crp/Fnr family transcriptional regulator [Vibrio gallaecicus]
MKTSTSDIQWPCNLSQALKDELLLSAITVHGLSDRNQFKRSSVDGVFYIVQGIMSISFASENTNTMNATLLSANTWAGGGVIYNSLSLNATIDEILPCTILYFPKEKIDRLASTNDEVFRWLYHCTLDLQKNWLQSQLCSLYDRESRIVFSLLDLAKRLPAVQGSLIKIDISQKQLSQITGISRPRLNEVLKSLEAANEISLERGSIHLIDIPSLNKKTEKLKHAFQTIS